MMVVVGTNRDAATRRSKSRGRWQGCLPRLLVGTACCVPALIAASLASSITPEADPFDRFFNATVPVMAAWLVLPVVVVATWRLPRPWPFVAAGVTVVGALVFGAWTMRPVAPTGGGYDIDIAKGEALLHDEVEWMLDAAVSGRWEQQWEERYACTDIYGRSEGAERTAVGLVVEGGISLDDQDDLRGALESAGWEVWFEEITFGGGPGRRLYAERDGFTVETWGTFLFQPPTQPPELSARTPCLPAEIPG